MQEFEGFCQYTKMINKKKKRKKEEIKKDNSQLKESLLAWAKENSFPIGTLMQCFRLALVGKLTGPDLFEICNLLGKELSLKRIDDLIKYINLKLT